MEELESKARRRGSLAYGHGSKSKACTPSEHPNPTPKMGPKMGGAPKTPKWDPIGFDNHSHTSLLQPVQPLRSTRNVLDVAPFFLNGPRKASTRYDL